MSSQQFFENELILKMIEELKADNIKMEGEFTPDDATYIMDRGIRTFALVTDKDANYLLDVLKKDYADLYKFAFTAVNDGSPRPYVAVPSILIDFTLVKYFPKQLEKYFSMYGKSYKKAAKLLISLYEQATGNKIEISTEKSEYSGMDDYYAMIIKSPYMEPKNENPVVRCTGKHEDSLLYTIEDKNKKDVKFLDVIRESYNLYISERLAGKIRTYFDNAKGEPEINYPRLGTGCVYFKDDKGQLFKYYGFGMPYLDVMDTKKMGKESTKVLFKPLVMKKKPEAERSIFTLNYRSANWRYCTETVKMLFENAGATGVRFEKAGDWDWEECSKLETYD